MDTGSIFKNGALCEKYKGIPFYLKTFQAGLPFGLIRKIVQKSETSSISLYRSGVPLCLFLFHGPKSEVPLFTSGQHSYMAFTSISYSTMFTGAFVMTKFTDQEWEEYLKDHQPEFEGDPDHLRILLEKSMVDWNMYRMRNDSFEPNLAYVKLELPQIIGTALYTVEANNKRPYCNLNNYNLQKANLAGANLFGVSLKKAVLAFSILKGASLTKTDLSDAVLSYADLRGAWLFDTNFRNANLVCAKIQNVRLSRTDFTNTMVSGIQYHNEIKIFGLVVWHKKSIDSFGSSILHSCLGNDMFKRFGLDQEFLESFKGSQPSWFYKPLYYLWKISSNCGQSMLTWILWSIVLAIYFSLNFYWMGSEWFSIKDNGLTEYSFNTFLYYSVATFTTLGFGDIIPKTPEAARWVMAEVITGYIMLGGLISIFATKLARRS